MLGEPISLTLVKSIEEAGGDEGIPVVEPVGAEGFTPSYGKVASAAGRISGNGIKLGVESCLNATTSALVTAPSSKEALHLAGFKYPGQTEMIAHLCGVDRSIMILFTGELRVGMVTTHVPLKDVSDILRQEVIEEKIVLFRDTLISHFGISNPRVAVSALNPHASDGGIFGQEEEAEIIPAIKLMQNKGINVVGPLPADTLFPHWKDFDGILALYHDQGMIPVKMAGFGSAVNLTGGLPFPRTSPDHGTAFDIAGDMIADSSSMERAIETAIEFAARQGTFNTEN